MNPNQDFIRQASQIISRQSSKGTYYVMAADITDFHTINHFYGDKEGDELLKQLETVLSRWPNMIFCHRAFADLFLCLFSLKDETGIDDIIRRNDLGIQTFLDEWRLEHPACNLKAACGICRLEGHDLTRAVDNANAARKSAKKWISSKMVLYDEAMDKQTAAHYETEQEIYSSLREKRFCFHLQPKVDLTTGEIIGAEALARRLGRHGEIIHPDAFLNAMEKSGAVIELDRLLCRQVCEFLSDRLEQNLPVVPVSVNLSRLHILNPGTADELHAMAEEYRVPPELLEFELTETILLDEFSGAKQLINKLRAYGHRVSIDDFGSGYSGISIWQELSFDCLKMDRVFLSDDPVLKERNEALVPNIINIAQRLHVQVLFEGVETEEQCLYLLKLGCTMVQGYFFSKPVPPEQLCRVLEENGKKYPLTPALRPSDAEKKALDLPAGYSSTSTDGRTIPYLLIVFICALFLGVCITGVLTISRKQTQKEFNDMIIETLNAYMEGQRESTLLEIDGITSTLDSMAVLLGRNDSPDFIDTYLLALNKDSQDVMYSYHADVDFQKQLAAGLVEPETAKTHEQLKRGETVVSEITFSKRLGDLYCIGIGVPVTKDGKFIGAVRGIIDAGTLVSTKLYNPAQGEIAAVFLTDSDSRILYTQKGGDPRDKYLLADMMDWGIDPATMEELRDAFASEDEEARSISIGNFDGAPYYISMTGLKYNDWHLVVCLKADRALDHSQRIVQNTVNGIAVLIAAVILASVMMLLAVWRMQQKFSLEEKRYLLLEHFSDTVLFDYDCRRCTIRFTSNSAGLFHIHKLTQSSRKGGRLDLSYIYAGDQNEVRQMLTGKAKDPSGKIRVRMARPDTDEYFWCLIQYQYLYEREMLVSVIGKITDIDEHMRNEERLLRMSETDGLTELLNKSAAEKLIAARLTQAGKGTLFVIDADSFKHINDKYGHRAGDLALRFIADCMRRTFRTGDILGRIGGDELVVFAAGIVSRETAQKKAELLLKHTETCTETDVPPLSVSVGAAIAPSDGESYTDLFLAADKAMYVSKQHGKRQITFYQDV